MNKLTLNLPHGSVTLQMGLNEFPNQVRRFIVSNDGPVRVARMSSPHSLMMGERLPDTVAYDEKFYELLPVAKDVHAGMDKNEFFRLVMSPFVIERFKSLVAKKKETFYVGDLNLEQVENLSVEYLQNFGSEQCFMYVFNLSPYHKFVALVDLDSAFTLYMTEDFTKAELVELSTDRWVIGRYSNDNVLLKELHSMNRYQPGSPR